MTDAEPTAQDDFREFLKELLPRNFSNTKLDQIIDEFTAYLDREIYTVEVRHARAPVETVEAYGLTIRLDAVGNAVTVSTDSMNGFFVC